VVGAFNSIENLVSKKNLKVEIFFHKKSLYCILKSLLTFLAKNGLKKEVDILQLLINEVILIKIMLIIRLMGIYLAF